MESLLKKWWGRNDGVTAVEFSMIAVPFVVMTVGIIEMALMFTSQALLQESTFTASRLIRTGQLQQSESAGQEQMFRDAVCDFSALLIPCNDIQFQVVEVPSFDEADDNPPQFDEDGNLLDTPFDPGDADSVNVIRVVYNYPIRTPLMQPLLANHDNGVRTMMSTIVLQAEPYE